MDSLRGRCGGPEPEVVTLIIPQFLQNALGCFTAKPDEDVSCLHKISLISPLQEPLYVDNEQDLKDALRQYCLYKQLCEKVDGEMKMLHLEFQLSENSIRLIRAEQAAKEAEEFGDTDNANASPEGYQERPHTAPQVSPGQTLARSSSAPCPSTRGMRPWSQPMRPRMRPAPRYEEDSGCCTIL